MGRWLARLQGDESDSNDIKKIEKEPVADPQNSQKSKKGSFEGFEGSESGVFEKKKSKSGRWLSKIKNSSVSFVGSKSVQKQTINRPKVWSLKVKTGGLISTMTVIDPARLNEGDFLKQQILMFGEGRIISFNEKVPVIKKGI